MVNEGILELFYVRLINNSCDLISFKNELRRILEEYKSLIEHSQAEYKYSTNLEDLDLALVDAAIINFVNELRVIWGAEDSDPLDGDDTEYIAHKVLKALDEANGNE